MAGVVDALGPSVSGVKGGDEVASFQLRLGGYGEYALVSLWTPKPANVTWSDAAALPASAEAAVGTLKQLRIVPGERLLILGAAGSVGIIATQLAASMRSEEHTSELQSHLNLVCRLLLGKKKTLSSQGHDAALLSYVPAPAGSVLRAVLNGDQLPPPVRDGWGILPFVAAGRRGLHAEHTA